MLCVNLNCNNAANGRLTASLFLGVNISVRMNAGGRLRALRNLLQKLLAAMNLRVA